MRKREATNTGLAASGCAAPSGFLSLLALCSSRVRSGFVSRRWHPWGCPFRGLLLSRRRHCLSAGLPLLALFDAVRRGEPGTRPLGCPTGFVPHSGGQSRRTPDTLAPCLPRPLMATDRTCLDDHCYASDRICPGGRKSLRNCGRTDSTADRERPGEVCSPCPAAIVTRFRASIPRRLTRSGLTRRPNRARRRGVGAQLRCITGLPKEVGSRAQCRTLARQSLMTRTRVAGLEALRATE